MQLLMCNECEGSGEVELLFSRSLTPVMRLAVQMKAGMEASEAGGWGLGAGAWGLGAGAWGLGARGWGLGAGAWEIGRAHV